MTKAHGDLMKYEVWTHVQEEGRRMMRRGRKRTAIRRRRRPRGVSLWVRACVYGVWWFGDKNDYDYVVLGKGAQFENM